MFVYTPEGIARMNFDGSGEALLFRAHGLHVLDVSHDLKTWVMSDERTNLLIGDAASGTVRRVPELAARTADAALSPDDRQIAAARHADFSLPQEDWVDDDAVYLVDVATLAVKVMPAASSDEIFSLHWGEDGRALHLSFFRRAEWLELSDHRRSGAPLLSEVSTAPRLGARFFTPHCGASLIAGQWDTSIAIVEDGRAPRALVVEEGRKRGFHDYLPDFADVTFAPGCQSVLFRFHAQLWGVEVATGRVGPIGPDSVLFFVQ